MTFDAEILGSFQPFETLAPVLGKYIKANQITDFLCSETSALDESQIATPPHERLISSIGSALKKRGFKKLKLLGVTAESLSKLREASISDACEAGVDDYVLRDWREKCNIGAGSHSLVFETTENQLLRMCFDYHDKSCNHPAILQPIDTFSISGIQPADIKISIMPKVKTSNVTQHHVDQISEVLAESGLYIPDLNIHNVGLIDIPEHDIYNLPMAIDIGNISALPMECHEALSPLINHWLNPEGMPWQNIFDPRIGSMQPTGVVDQETLERLEKSRGPTSRIVTALKEGGYAEHVQKALSLDDALSQAR